MKPGITRWKSVPSYSFSFTGCFDFGSVQSFSPFASSTKFLTAFGASAGRSFTPIFPREVTKTAKRSPFAEGCGFGVWASAGEQGRATARARASARRIMAADATAGSPLAHRLPGGCPARPRRHYGETGLDGPPPRRTSGGSPNSSVEIAMNTSRRKQRSAAT